MVPIYSFSTLLSLKKIQKLMSLTRHSQLRDTEEIKG